MLHFNLKNSLAKISKTTLLGGLSNAGNIIFNSYEVDTHFMLKESKSTPDSSKDFVLDTPLYYCVNGC